VQLENAYRENFMSFFLAINENHMSLDYVISKYFINFLASHWSEEVDIYIQQPAGGLANPKPHCFDHWPILCCPM
jgi:hypothetical protein